MDLELDYRGQYWPSFFSIFLNGDFDTSLEKMTEEDLGTFAHEYMHYIQNIDTLCGLANSQFYHIFIAELKEYIDKSPTITIPISDFNLSNITLNNKKNFDDNRGDGEQILYFQYDDYEIAVEGNGKVNLIFEQNGKCVQKIHYGSLAVKEGMADLFQKKFDKNVTHPTVPYLLTELLCEKLNPKLLDDKNAILYLSFLSLNSIDCGKQMYDCIIESTKLEWRNAFELYLKIRDTTLITINDIRYSINEAKLFALDKLQDTMSNVLISKLSYFQKVFGNIRLINDDRVNGFIGLCESTRLTKIELLNNLIDIYELPHIYTATGKNILRSNSTDLIELLSQRVLLKRLLDGKQQVCTMIQLCQQDAESDITDENCYETQWKRTHTCPFKLTFDYWKLNTKI